MVGGTIPPQSDSGEISRVLVLNLLWQSKRCSRTAQDISVLTTPSLLSMSMTRQLKSFPRHPNSPADPPIRPLALNRCALWIAARKSARKSFDLTDGSSINEGLQENLRRLGLRLLHSFHEP